MNAAHEGAVKGMYIMGENPAMSDPNLRHVREALASLDHLVVQELFLTETASYADVVLPASAWPEKDGTVTNTNRQVQMGRHRADDAGRRQAGLVDHPGDRTPHRAPTGTTAARPTSSPRWRGACPPSTTSAGRGCSARSRRHLPLQRRGRARPRRDLRGRLSDSEQAGHKLVPAGIVPPDESPDDEFPWC